MTYPTVEQVRCYLMDDNLWTEEEYNEFIEANSDSIQGEGTTLTFDQWEFLAANFVDTVPPEPDTMNDDHWNESRGK